MATTAPPRPRRLDSLTSLRAIAALAVFGFHASIRFKVHHGARIVSTLTSAGATGVTFFFILSGFVLTWSHRPGDRVTSFYRRRVARIYPAYIVAVAAGVVVTAYEYGKTSLLPHKAIALAVVMAQAWSPRPSTYFGVNGPLWSLSCEAFFYLLFPALIAGLLRTSDRGRLALLIGLVAVGYAVQVPLLLGNRNGTVIWLTNIFPPVHLIEFVIGMLLALHLKSGRRSPISAELALVIAAAVYLTSHGSRRGLVLLPYALVIFAVAAKDERGAGKPWLQWRVLLIAGQWSYSFYLLHALVIRAWQKALPATGGFSALAGTLVITAIAAGFLYYAWERPADRWLRGDRTVPVSEGGSGARQR